MLNKYLIENYHKLKDMAYNITSGKGNDDLFSFVIEELYKCDQDRIDEIITKNQMTFYVVRVMINQYHSKTSRYYYKYKKYYEYHTTTTIECLSADNTQYNIKEKQEIEERLEWIEEKLKDLYWFDAEVFKIYYREGFSLNQMQKETKINRNTLHKAITNVKKYLLNEKE
jgi:DNA-directed RNA polymerase specialized sigma24 family protein|tara:strand:- start:559 stop:1068 length:510 start_codon:yes stop_codon:yes gene_type:complete